MSQNLFSHLVGRLVVLNSGSHSMVITGISASGVYADVSWSLEDGALRSETFPVVALKLVEFQRLSNLLKEGPK